jgi:hypothetical protein
MKTAMRRELARQPFEEKIRKVGQLIKLSATMKSSRVRERGAIDAASLADSRTHRGGACRK